MSIVVIGAVLRVAAIGQQGLWHDEIYTLGNLVGFDIYLFPGSDVEPRERERAAGAFMANLKSDRFLDNFWRTVVHEGHPPLYLLLLKLWSSVFGTSVDWIRGFSVASSTLAVAYAIASGRRIAGWTAGFAAGLFFAVSPYQVYFAVEARSYALMTLWAAVATWAWLGLLYSRSTSNQGAWIAAVVGACLTHYFAALYCGLLFLALVIRWRIDGAVTKRRLALWSAPLLTVIAWLPVWRLQVAAHSGNHWTEGHLGWADAFSVGLTNVLELLIGPQPSDSWGAGIVVLSLCAIGGGALITRRSEPWARISGLLLALVGAHIVTVVIVDHLIDHHTISVSRYSSCLAIPLTLVIASALSRRRFLGLLLAFIYGAVSLHASWEVAIGARAPKQMLRETAAHLNSVANDEDLIIVSPSGPTLIGLALYLRPELRVAAEPADSLAEAVEAGQRQGRRVWTVQQRLGVEIEPWAAAVKPEAQSVLRFAGVDLAAH